MSIDVSFGKGVGSNIQPTVGTKAGLPENDIEKLMSIDVSVGKDVGSNIQPAVSTRAGLDVGIVVGIGVGRGVGALVGGGLSSELGSADGRGFGTDLAASFPLVLVRALKPIPDLPILISV